MISREEIYTMLILRKRQDTLFYTLPIELIQEISTYSLALNSNIANALYHAAYARQEDVTALLDMLEANPRLLLQRGDATTPGGDEIRRVTIYELLLGAGDDELALKVQAYFEKIENGEQERIRQYERYRPYIEGMLTQKPYNLSPLIELIKKASSKEVEALLNKDMTGDSGLCKAIIQFRKDWAPRVLSQPCMHYNYVSLQHAFELLDKEWDNLYKANGNNYDMIDLVWRQLIGFEVRRLPGIDRCVMAQGLHYVIKNGNALTRSYNLRNGSTGANFPITLSDDSLVGLGGDWALGAWGVDAESAPCLGQDAWVLENLCRTKTSNFQNLCNHTQLINRARV